MLESLKKWWRGKPTEPKLPTLKVKDRTLHFLLREGSDTLSVEVVEEDGRMIQGGQIVSITAYGIHLFSGVNPSFGLPLGDKNKVAIM